MSHGTSIDVAFSKLLSSQRELLNSMHQQRKSVSPSIGIGSLWPVNDSCLHLENTWEESVASQPQHYGMSRRSSLDMILSRRLSIGMGFSGNAKELSNYDADVRRVLLDNDFSLFSEEDFECDWNETSQHKKRRLSQCSGIYPLDELEPTKRTPVGGGEKAAVCFNAKESRSHEKDDAPLLKSSGDGVCETVDAANDGRSKDQTHTEVWTWLYTKALRSFQAAMKQSESSRQGVHKLDSKTDQKILLSSFMNKSSLSRKRLWGLLSPNRP